MLKILMLMALLFVSANTSADFLSGSTISKLYGAGTISFGVDNAPSASTCNYYNRHFKFDATTESGKNMLSIILAAYMSGKKISIWYTASSAPGTDHDNGCANRMATMTLIGLD